MNILNKIDENVVSINISCKNIVGLLDFSKFKKLIYLNCSFNNITSLNNLRS